MEKFENSGKNKTEFGKKIKQILYGPNLHMKMLIKVLSQPGKVILSATGIK